MTGEEKSIGRQQFARELSVILGYPINDCRVFMDAYDGLITELVKRGVRVCMTGFGVFEPRYVASRDYHDVCHHGTYITKPEFNTIKFKPSDALIEKLNQQDEEQ